MLLVGDPPPGPPAAHVLLVGLEHVPQRRLSLLLAGDRGDDPGDARPHAHLLVPYVVALHEVVSATGPGEVYRSYECRSPDHLGRLEKVSFTFGDLRDDAHPG